MSLFRRLETLGERDAPTSMQGLYLPGLRYSLRMVDADTLEVTRMDNGIIRAIMWGMFWLTTYFVVQSWWEQNLLWWWVQMLVFPAETLKGSYDQLRELNPSNYPMAELPEYISETLGRYSHVRWYGLIFLALPTFFFYCAFVWPRYRPLRFNRKHRIAYTWSWGRFF